ncbi:hypothetical protein AB4865_03355 [Capnocytophaga sp. ARDL2]|uniref:hypothetical protein n=1 Tax=Capnocytophaga sp. ARDL2 TaxID=3238809 RepID=UPI0035578070
MIKLTLSILALSFFFSSCNKEELSVTNENIKNKEVSAFSKQKTITLDKVSVTL